MANFHTIGNSAPETPAAAPPAPAEPAIEPVEASEAEDLEEDLSAGSDEAPAAEEPAGAEIDPELEYMVDGEPIKGKDLLSGRLMQADYTRKTQAVAEERKRFQARAEQAEDERDDLVSWAESLSNPERMEYELESNFPEAFAALRERIIEQALQEHELSGKPEFRYYQEARRAAMEKIAQKAEQEQASRTQQRTQRRAQVGEMRTTFEGWTKSAMESAGLNVDNVAQRTAVQDRLLVGHKDEKWTAETFAKAAKYVAGLVGAKAPPPKSEEKPALPPVSMPGHKAKPAQRVQAETVKARAKAPKTFDDIRRLHKAF